MVRYMIKKDDKYWNEGKWLDQDGGIKFLLRTTAFIELLRIRNFFNDNGNIVAVTIDDAGDIVSERETKD